MWAGGGGRGFCEVGGGGLSYATIRWLCSLVVYGTGGFHHVGF